MPELLPLHFSYTRPTICMPLDQAATFLGVRNLGVVKIDAESAELEVIDGMASMLERWRPPIICEVLRPVRGTDQRIHAKRALQLREIIDKMDYGIFSIVKPRSGPQTIHPVREFPGDTWSLLKWGQNDYLFIPSEQAEDAAANIS